MTHGDHFFPAVPSLAVWSRGLSAPQRLWAGHLRIWQTEVALPSPTVAIHHFLQQMAHTTHTPIAEMARRYGLAAPEPEEQRPRATIRRMVNFVETPTGPVRVDLKGLYLPNWSQPLLPEHVPATVYTPEATGGLSLQGDDWHTVPVVRALSFLGTAAEFNESICVYPLKPSAGTINPEPLFQIPKETFATPTPWHDAWHAWCHAHRVATDTPVPTIAHGEAHLPRQHPLAHFVRREAENPASMWLVAVAGPFHEIARLCVGAEHT